MRNLYTLLFIIFFYILLPAVISHADVPESQKPEVEHLLEFVRSSDCKLERNGKLYDGERAARHIREKYEYFRDKITSTETFIEYSATKSMISGKYYLVHCGDEQSVKTFDWLLTELKRYRAESDAN